MRILIIAALAFALLTLLGCEGATTHRVITDEDGTLRGLEITPEPQSLDLYTDEPFYLDWDYGYPPPPSFTVKLQRVDSDGTLSGVLTELTRLSTGHYRLDPNWLSDETFYLLTVSTPYEEERAMYLTHDSAFREQRSLPNGKLEHTVTTP